MDGSAFQGLFKAWFIFVGVMMVLIFAAGCFVGYKVLTNLPHISVKIEHETKP